MKYTCNAIRAVAALLSIIILMGSASVPAAAIREKHENRKKWESIINASRTTGENSDQSGDLEVNRNTSILDNLEFNRFFNLISNRDTDLSEKSKNERKPSAEQETYKTSRFIVKYTDGTPGKNREKDREKGKENAKNGESKIRSGLGKKVKSVKVKGSRAVLETDSEMNAAELAKSLTDSTIEYIQPDYVMEPMAVDPLLSRQWGHAQESGVDANVPEAWNTATGDGVVVAVLDTGYFAMHEDLSVNILIRDARDFVNDDDVVDEAENKFEHWHGTHIAGIIAAEKGNGIGIAGVAPDAKVLPLKIFESGVAYTSDIIDAIEYAESKGAKIANCSWGTLYENPALRDAMDNSEMLFVCAAGNNLYNIDNYSVYPAAFNLDNIISVSSIDKDGRLSRYSNYGPNSVDIAAPGNNILSTWIDNEYQETNGTSMAAAYVSGAAALVYSQDLSLSAADVKSRIISSADTVTGLQDKIRNGKKLNCGNAVSNSGGSNIDIPDPDSLPAVTPEGIPEDEYTPYAADGSVTARTHMPARRCQAEAVTVGDKIYVMGGYNEFHATGYANEDVFCYDPRQDIWSTMSNMIVGRAKFSAVESGGKIYVFGGNIPSTEQRPTSAAEVFDSLANTWSSIQDLPRWTSGLSATAIPGTNKIYLIGGYANFTPDFYPTLRYSKEVYEYDISTNQYTRKPDFQVTTSGHAAFYREENGQRYIYVETTNNEYKYNIDTGATLLLGPSRISYVESGVAHANCFISVGKDVIASSNILTPFTGEYVSASRLLTSRFARAVAMFDGKVFAFGGRQAMER